MKTFLILLIIVLSVLLLVQLCKPAPKPDDTALRNLIKAKEDTLSMYRALRAQDSIRINEAGQAAADQAERRDVAQRALNNAQATINRLTAKIQGAKHEPKDGTWVEVSPHYVEGCDSLTKEVGVLNDRIDEYEDQNAELNKLMHYEVAVRDSALNNEKEFSKKFRQQLDDCLTQFSNKVVAKQPLQIYVGGGALGNRINPLAGGQLNLALRARNSQIYELTGAMVGNTWYAGAGVKVLVTFKR